MKIVIDVPEEEYARIQSMDWKNGDRIYDEAERAIHYGKPLEEVLGEIKAEINRKASSGQWSEATVYGMQKAISVIDSHISGKEQSE